MLIKETFSFKEAAKYLEKLSNVKVKKKDIYQLAEQNKLTLSIATNENTVALIETRKLRVLQEDLDEINYFQEKNKNSSDFAEKDSLFIKIRNKKRKLEERCNLWEVVPLYKIFDVKYITTKDSIVAKNALVIEQNETEYFLLYFNFLSSLKYKLFLKKDCNLCVRGEELDRFISKLQNKTIPKKPSDKARRLKGLREWIKQQSNAFNPSNHRFTKREIWDELNIFDSSLFPPLGLSSIESFFKYVKKIDKNIISFKSGAPKKP